MHACLREKEHLFRYRAYFEGNLLRFVRAPAHVRALTTRVLCAVGMRNAKLRNHLNEKRKSKLSTFTIIYKCYALPVKCVQYGKCSVSVVSVTRWHLNRFMALVRGPTVSMDTDKRNAGHFRECACARLGVASLNKNKDIFIKKQWSWNED